MIAAQHSEGGRRTHASLVDVRVVRGGAGDAIELCASCAVADTPLRRMRGLLGRRGLAAREGLLIRPCGAVHTWFMRFAIDAVFLDADGIVVGVARDLRPWRFAGRRGATSVVEVAAGTCASVQVAEGDRLTFTRSAEER